jgi:hypothetical protein
LIIIFAFYFRQKWESRDLIYYHGSFGEFFI